MHNCLIMGSGRSGTSMVAGTLAKKYYMGKNLIPPRASNPKGFFESSFINLQINEPLLAPILPNFVAGQRWLSIFPMNGKLPKVATLRKRMKAVTGETPFCYKDPRFCYTLPAWRPFLTNTKFICVFRHPIATAQSIIRSCKTDKYLRTINMTTNKALSIWAAMYSHVIKKHQHIGDWLFVHYDQMFDIDILYKIENFLGTAIDKTFPEKRLRKKVQKKINLPNDILLLYKDLCALASFGKK